MPSQGKYDIEGPTTCPLCGDVLTVYWQLALHLRDNHGSMRLGKLNTKDGGWPMRCLCGSRFESITHVGGLFDHWLHNPCQEIKRAMITQALVN